MTWSDTAPHPWRRYFARMLDVMWLGGLASFGLEFVVERAAPATYGMPYVDWGNAPVVGSFILVAASLPPCALAIGLTGTSPGKWLFGVRVLDAGGAPIGVGRALSREVAVWFRGLGLAIPIVTLVTCIVAFNHLKACRSTTWDEARDLRVVHRSMGVGQVLGALAGMVLLVAPPVAAWLLGGH